MKALLLSAGFGTRLGALTREIPKPLIKVGEEPILAFCLDQLWKAGVSDVVINTHYLSNQIQDFIKNHDTEIKVHLSHEDKLLGTAGTLKKHVDYLSDQDFIVMHADNFFSDSLSSFVRGHRSRKVGNFGSMGAFDTESPENCGVLVLKPDNTVLEFHEKVASPPTNLANAAIYLFTPEVRKPLLQLTHDENDLSRNLIPKIMGGLYVHRFKGLFVDIGIPEGLKLACDYKEELRRSETN